MKRVIYSLLSFLAVAILISLVKLSPEALTERGVGLSHWIGLPPLLVASLPPLIGITLAVATRRLVLSLAIGVGFAAFLAAGPWPLPVITKFIGDYLIKVMIDPFHIAILVFTTALIGMVGTATRSGGTRGVVEGVLKYAKGRRGARVSTVLMGFAVFFDDYANTAIVGPTVQPLFDRLKISREKLAYLIDSTAAPVAGLAIVSTWIGTEVGYLQEAAMSVGITTSGYALFFSALAFRFYCMFALVLVILIAASGRDYGPMYHAEKRACTTGEVKNPETKPVVEKKAETFPDIIPRARYALVPIGTVLTLMLTSVYMMGKPEDTGTFGPLNPLVWRDAFITASEVAGGNGLAYVFALAALAGALVAIFMPAASGVLKVKEGGVAFLKAAKEMALALAILIAAWALSSGCSDLHTADYVAAALHGRIPAEAIPFIIFAVAGAVAFATGSSWGTMAILIPTAAPVAFHAGGEGVMIIAMAAVLDGAIFGDHMSPISDTTILSSICSGCDHMDHVRTQIPYAMTGFVAASVAGYGMVGAFGAPLWLGYFTGVAIVTGTVFLLGRRADLVSA